MRLYLLVGLIIIGIGSTGLTPAAAGPGGPPVSLPPRVQVVVVGGGPAGIAAAVAAARAGMRTVLIAAREELGGDITSGWLNTFDMNWGPHGEHLTRGIFLEMYRALGQTFDISQARTFFADLVAGQPNLTVLTRARVTATLMRGNAVSGVMVSSDRDRFPTPLLAEVVIDATDDAVVAAGAGASYTLGREDTGLDKRMQAATLIFKLGGVNQQAVHTYLITHDKPRLRGGAYGRYAWGYSRIARDYQSTIPRLRMFDLNLGWQSDGTVLVNALQIFDVDGTDPRSVQEGRALALAELPSIVAFLRASAPGFERAILLDAAPYLYIRETRHIIGLYRMQVEDILERRDFWDRVAVASYPIDIHPSSPNDINGYKPIRYPYAIPFRALVPLGVDRLMVVGKAVSATHAAFGSVRIIPTQVALGEAAGEAAAVAVTARTTPAKLAEDRSLVAELQSRLIATGAYLPNPQSLYVGSGKGRTSGSTSKLLPSSPTQIPQTGTPRKPR